MSASRPTNLYLHAGVTAAAKQYVEGNRKVRSISELVQNLLVRELKAKRIKLPDEFTTKPADRAA